MAAILPVTEYLRKRKVPKLFAVLIPYFGISTAFFLLIFTMVPFIIDQVESLAKDFPKYLDRTANIFGVTEINPRQVQSYLTSQVDNVSSSAFEVTTRVFGGIFTVITIFVVSLYLLLYNDQFKKFIAKLFHNRHHDKALRTVSLVNEKLGAWLQGQMFLSFFIGIITWIALTLLGIPLALPLAIIAGMLEVIPTLGPTLAAIPAIIIAFTISPTLALAVLVTYILIQMLENQLLVPKIMERAVGLNPVVVILGVSIGANLLGVVGALLAIPFISFVIVIYKSIEAQK